MKTLIVFLLMLFASVTLQFPTFSKDASAGVLGRSVSKAIARKAARKKVLPQAYRHKVLRRDALRDKASKSKPLVKSQYVRRYTSQKQAHREQLNGISPKTHMTSKIPTGRPISVQTAKKRYGLNKQPEVRMTILVPKGQPVKKNKVIGGQPGYGEIISTKFISRKNIMEVKKLPQ